MVRLAVASLFLPGGTVEPLSFQLEAVRFRASFHPLVEERIDRTLTGLNEIGAHVLYPEHPAYPQAFYELESPPLYLSCLGNLDALHAPQRIAIVGAREMSARSERWLEHHLPDFLKSNPDVAVVSGGARGADQAAHLACVRAKRPTVVFLPSGLSRIFPHDLERWVKPVIDAGGVFVSAYAPDEQVRRFRFEARNRLIAALGHMTFVAEASRRSGSLMTARLSTELSREVCVLPSFPGDPAGQGTLDLLVNGATPIRDADDLSMLLSRATPQYQRRLVVPAAPQTPCGGEREQTVDGPHGDDGRQLTFT